MESPRGGNHASVATRVSVRRASRLQFLAAALIAVGAVITGAEGHVFGAVFLAVCAVAVLAIGRLLAPRGGASQRR